MKLETVYTRTIIIQAAHSLLWLCAILFISLNAMMAVSHWKIDTQFHALFNKLSEIDELVVIGDDEDIDQILDRMSDQLESMNAPSVLTRTSNSVQVLTTLRELVKINDTMRINADQQAVDLMAQSYLAIIGSLLLFGGSIGITTSIASNRLKFELELVKSERTYQTLVSHFPKSVIALFNTDLRFVILEGSDLPNVGVSSSTHVGRYVWEVSFSNQENRDLFEKHYRLALSGVQTEFEFFRNADVYHVTVAPIFNAGGVAVGGISIAQNITSERVAKKMLEEEWEALRNLIDTIPHAIYFINTSGKFLVANQQFLKLFQAKGLLVGQTYRDVFDQNTATINTSEDYAIIRGAPELHRLETISDRYYEVLKTPFQQGQHVSGVVCIYRDITQQKESETVAENLRVMLEKRAIALELANNELEAFSYSVSHDLRAPLRAIHGFAQIIIDEHGPRLDDDVLARLKVVQSNAKKMDALINGLLSFSKLGRQQMTVVELDTAKIVADVWAELNDSQNQAKIVVATLTPCYGDQLLIKLVFENLISNAVKFSRNVALPKIEIGETQTPEGVTYFVKDNGVGMNLKYAAKIFGVFQRFHNAVEYEGTGVGLAIVHRIIARHHGKIWVESEPNQGTTFYFTIRGDRDN